MIGSYRLNPPFGYAAVNDGFVPNLAVPTAEPTKPKTRLIDMNEWQKAGSGLAASNDGYWVLPESK
ncbi:hypothetical protein [uncultured Sphingomonas sp.]|uniref:hypothetical protein n=1 Tax=uncultured Sphingomonas sp. TaxID=158754 RepID=UPI0025FB737A|nr:hypothetical protein [uncultured Sphingomonas sp.]